MLGHSSILQIKYALFRVSNPKQHSMNQSREYIPDDFKKMKNRVVSKDETMTNQIG